MEKEYKFISKFIEGKTYNELTDEEIEKLKSGVGVKKEDKEYIDSLEKSVLEEQVSNEVDSKTEETIQNTEINEKRADNVIIKENVNKSGKGTKVIKAIGKTIVLEDGKIIKLNSKELKEKPFWRKGDIYYG